MKEIKFRAKLIFQLPNQKIGDWYYWSVTDGFTSPKNFIDIETICEFTGVTDKNNKDIYDRDWLGHESRHMKKTGIKGIHIVKWNTERTCFEMPSPLKEFEIVGNNIDGEENS